MTDSTTERSQRPKRVLRERIVGVIGGMGPRATIDFMSKVVRLTPAMQNQGHIRMIVDHNPKAPDRTESIQIERHETISAIVDSGDLLAQAGADFLAMPRNTAHSNYEEIPAECLLPLSNMISEVVKELELCSLSGRRVGLLATDATVSSRLHQNACRRIGAEMVLPHRKTQPIAALTRNSP